MNVSFIQSLSLTGVQGSPKGAGLSRPQPEAFCQPDTDADRPDAEAEAAVGEGGGGHAEALAVLRLPP